MKTDYLSTSNFFSAVFSSVAGLSHRDAMISQSGTLAVVTLLADPQELSVGLDRLKGRIAGSSFQVFKTKMSQVEENGKTFFERKTLSAALPNGLS